MFFFVGLTWQGKEQNYLLEQKYPVNKWSIVFFFFCRHLILNTMDISWKNRLQEYCQKKKLPFPDYRFRQQTNTPNGMRFQVSNKFSDMYVDIIVDDLGGSVC